MRKEKDTDRERKTERDSVLEGKGKEGKRRKIQKEKDMERTWKGSGGREKNRNGREREVN